MRKRITIILLCAVISMRIFAFTIDKHEKEFEFCFIFNRDMLYADFNNNKTSLQSLCEFIQVHKDEIKNSGIPIKVEGHCDNLAIAKLRSNRVKSEMILNNGLKEQNFLTFNSRTLYNGNSNIVLVRIMLPANCDSQAVRHNESNDSVTAHHVEQPTSVTDNLSANTMEEDTQQQSETLNATISKPILAVKTNLLFDVASLLNVELEVPIGNRWSIAGEYMFPWWQGKAKDWAVQVISGSLEGRYWFGNREKLIPMTGFFAGLYAGGGYYDLENHSKGYQGEFFIASGLSGGFAHILNKSGSLRMEYSLGIGYLKTKYRYYEGEENNEYFVWQHDGHYTWMGPTKAKISLVWMLNINKKGGNR